jgi:hypothetical protein
MKTIGGSPGSWRARCKGRRAKKEQEDRQGREGRRNLPDLSYLPVPGLSLSNAPGLSLSNGLFKCLMVSSAPIRVIRGENVGGLFR